MPVLMLFGLMLIVMLMRVTLPFGANTEGKVIAQASLSFRERLLYQRINVYAIGLVLALAAVTGAVSGPIEMVVILATFSILMLPVRYTLTSRGIAINNVVFRPWTDFHDIDEQPRKLRLLAHQGMRNFDMYLLAGHQKQVLGALHQQLKSQRSPNGERKVKVKRATLQSTVVRR